MSNNALRIAFMGTPDFSVSALKALVESNHDVVCVYSQPPRPKGRGKKVQTSPVHEYALSQNIEVRTPLNFKNADDVKAFDDLNLDVAVVAAYGLILPKSILDAPQYGCINIHASILPRWRGAAPIHRAIWAGDSETGVTLMQMDEGLDTGDMISIERVPITNQSTLPQLHDELSALGARMIAPCIDALAQNEALDKTVQPDDGMTYAHMLKKEHGHIDWSQTATEIDRQVRALNPWPGTWSVLNEKRVKILEVKVLSDDVSNASVGEILDSGKVSCGDKTVLQIVTLQPENKKPMDVKVALNGDHLKIGDALK